jgi:hypothetical protein
MTGQPKVVSSLTTASTDDVLAVTLSPKLGSVGDVMARMLAAFSEPALLYYNAALNTVVGTTDAATIALIQTMFDGDTGTTLTLTPLDTYGVRRRFQVVENSLGDDAFAATLANDKQKRNLGGLVNLAANLKFQARQQGLDVLVSQFNSHVIFKQSDGTTAAALPSFPPSGQTVGIQITNPPKQGKKIFE